MSYTLLLRQLRKEKHLTQGELAARINTTERVVGAWERQETQISLEDAFLVCEALGCTPNELTGWYIEHPEDRPNAAAPTLDRDEAVLLADYRACTPARRQTVASAARDQRALSEDSSPSASSPAPVLDLAV